MNTRTCPSCGHAISGQPKFCPECGTALTAKQKPKSPPAGSHAVRDTVLIVGVLVLVAVGYFVFRDRPTPPPPAQSMSATPDGADHASMAALDNIPQNYDTLVAVSNQYMDQGNYAMAAELYRRALEINGSDNNVRTDFGACLNGMGLPERAIEEFKKVIASDPSHAIALFNAGIVFFNLKQEDSARVYWK